MIRAGQLEYWKNSGTSASPSFALEDEQFLGLASSTLRQNLACATGDLGADGKTDLIVGDQNGRILSIYAATPGFRSVPSDLHVQ